MYQCFRTCVCVCLVYTHKPRVSALARDRTHAHTPISNSYYMVDNTRLRACTHGGKITFSRYVAAVAASAGAMCMHVYTYGYVPWRVDKRAPSLRVLALARTNNRVEWYNQKSCATVRMHTDGYVETLYCCTSPQHMPVRPKWTVTCVCVVYVCQCTPRTHTFVVLPWMLRANEGRTRDVNCTPAHLTSALADAKPRARAHLLHNN